MAPILKRSGCRGAAQAVQNRSIDQGEGSIHPYDRPLLMDRRHWLLLVAALACIAGLVLWIGEIDLGMEESIAPGSAPASAPAPTAPAQP